MTTGGSSFGGLFPGILESEPQLPFFSALNRQQGLSPNQRRFFETQFDSIFNRFQGQLGQAIQTGPDTGPGARPPGEQLPSFEDFVNDFDFRRDFMSRPPNQRPGSGTSAFAPPVQFLRRF